MHAFITQSWVDGVLFYSNISSSWQARSNWAKGHSWAFKCTGYRRGIKAKQIKLRSAMYGGMEDNLGFRSNGSHMQRWRVWDNYNYKKAMRKRSMENKFIKCRRIGQRWDKDQFTPRSIGMTKFDRIKKAWYTDAEYPI
ncbi:hypothetical protein L1987_74324 [Smallanthus sonchifolius]|uniref:Uncharacterized protein n=1 Tax=Smallanthus sonchifolius TaxID=185202 RepID=A0ACB9A3K2_9ASTR|nr:hypothetical protein L1987_74324 [Smallanthus sonchifolius]